MEILDQIKEVVSKETRTPEELYSYIKQLGMIMFFSKKLTDSQVIYFCSSLISLYNQMKEKENGKDN